MAGPKAEEDVAVAAARSYIGAKEGKGKGKRRLQVSRREPGHLRIGHFIVGTELVASS